MVFVGVSAVLFAGSTAITIAWCTSMAIMNMPMPGGWTMSMAWMRMPGQTWPGAAASFLGMWTVMTIAMMSPTLFPMLWRYRQAVATRGETRLGRHTVLAGMGYVFVWAVIGLAVYPVGMALATIAMRQSMVARAVPIAAGVVVVVAGSLQFASWKARQLACCREDAAEARTPWQHGVRLGRRCARCCANLMAVLLVIGVMDLRAMALVGAAIAVERAVPSGERVAPAIGAVVVGAGVMLLVRAVAVG